MRKIACVLLNVLIFNAYFYGQTVVENKIIYERKGTSTQKINGYLYINERLLPDVFDLVYFEGKMYEFAISENPFDNEGYIQTYKNIMVVVAVENIQSLELAKGYYLGEKLHKGTPEDWIFVKWKNNCAFVSPEKIDILLSDQNLPYIARSKSKQPYMPLFYKLFLDWYNNRPNKEDKQFILDLTNLEIKNPTCEISTYEHVIKCWIYFEEWERLITELKNKKFIESYLLCNSDPVGIIRNITNKIPGAFTNRMNESLKANSIIISTQKPGKKKCGFEHDYKSLSEEVKGLMK